MIVKELIEILKKVENQDADVTFTYDARTMIKDINIVDFESYVYNEKEHKLLVFRSEKRDDWEWRQKRGSKHHFGEDYVNKNIHIEEF